MNYKENTEGPSIHTEELALFSKPPVNVGEDKISWVEYRPTFMSSGEYSSVQFHIPGNSSQYIDMNRSELYVKIKIKKVDGTEFKNEEKESALPIDLILHSMWSSVDIKMNHTLVSTSGTDYMHKALIETLLNYNEGAKRNQMSAIGFSGESGNFSQTHPDTVPFNHGLKTRNSWFKDVKTVEFMGPLFADICNQDRLILPSVDIDIKLWPTHDEFRLITHPYELECKLMIEDIYFNVCKVAVFPLAMMGHYAALEISKSQYPFQRTDIRTFNIAENSYGTTLEDIWQGEVPSCLVIGMVKSEAYNGEFDMNPFLFDHFNIASAGFYVNGEQTPRSALKFRCTKWRLSSRFTKFISSFW